MLSSTGRHWECSLIFFQHKGRKFRLNRRKKNCGKFMGQFAPVPPTSFRQFDPNFKIVRCGRKYGFSWPVRGSVGRYLGSLEPKAHGRAVSMISPSVRHFFHKRFSFLFLSKTTELNKIKFHTEHH